MFGHWPVHLSISGATEEKGKEKGKTGRNSVYHQNWWKT